MQKVMNSAVTNTGVAAGGAVWPLIFLVFWDRCTGKAAISGKAAAAVLQG